MRISAERTTGIGWTRHTFNGWSGCVKISEGCRHCYAADLPAARRRNAEWGLKEPRVAASESYWKQPLTWDRAAREAGETTLVFSASTSDVFEDRDDLDPLRARLFALIRATPNLTWQLLTKRSDRMLRYAKELEARGEKWPSNAWAGVSLESMGVINRVRDLVQMPVPVRFLSCEPLLGPLDLTPYLSEIDWVIAGGESGASARVMHSDWVRLIRNQCIATKTAFFFKQWGRTMPWREASLPEPSEGWPLRDVVSDEDQESLGVASVGDELRVNAPKDANRIDGTYWLQMPTPKDRA